MVLIIVIAVDGLGALLALTLQSTQGSLNPCYSGRWSRSDFGNAYDTNNLVLILVIAVDGLGDYGCN